jgi:hypothetical protein
MWERVALATIADYPGAGEPAELEFGDVLAPLSARHPGDEEEEDEEIDADADDDSSPLLK